MITPATGSDAIPSRSGHSQHANDRGRPGSGSCTNTATHSHACEHDDAGGAQPIAVNRAPIPRIANRKALHQGRDTDPTDENDRPQCLAKPSDSTPPRAYNPVYDGGRDIGTGVPGVRILRIFSSTSPCRTRRSPPVAHFSRVAPTFRLGCVRSGLRGRMSLISIRLSANTRCAEGHVMVN